MQRILSEVLRAENLGGLRPADSAGGVGPGRAGQVREDAAGRSLFSLGEKKLGQGQRGFGGGRLSRGLRPQAVLGGSVEMMIEEERQGRGSHAVVGRMKG